MTRRTTNSNTAGDSLATGLLFMLSLTAVQRLVGFGRSVVFCGVLEDDQLGRWSLAFSFLLLLAPLSVLGITGSFGRYVEYYRQRRQLASFLRRTVAVAGLCATAALVLLWMLDEQVAWLAFGDVTLVPFVHLLIAALAVVIVFNFVTDLLTALRQIRAVAVMQLVCSCGFAVIGIGLLLWTELREQAVLLAYAASATFAVLVAAVLSRRLWSGVGRQQLALPQSRLWPKLLPFAAWVWVTNLLSNLFDAADRFMIVHLSVGSTPSAESLVGQYHCSRVVPLLLVSVAGMVSGIILPYLSHEWENRRRREVSALHALSIKLGGLSFTAFAAGILVAAPLLFSWLLRGKYDQGLAVLPWTLTYCVWFSITLIAQNYLWCAERARLGSLALLLGLVVNIVLNVLLLPHWGLTGAVVATSAANVVALLLVIRFSQVAGFRADLGLYLCCCLPVVLLLGALPSLAAVIGFSFVGGRRGWLFSEAEWRMLTGAVGGYCEWLARHFPWCGDLASRFIEISGPTRLSDQVQ